MYQLSSYSTNVQVGFCGFLIVTIVGNGFQTCGKLFQAGRAHLDCSCLSLFPHLIWVCFPFFFFFLLFLLIFANLTKDAQWSFADIYLKQWNKEQNHTFLAPTSPLEPRGVRPGRAEQNEQSPVTTFPPHHCPHSRVAWKLKYPLVYLQLSSALVKNTYTKHNLCARIWYPAQWFVSKILIRAS